MKPKTPLENKMRNEVRTLRQQEERSALGRMRTWQRHASRHVDDRMNRYKDLTLDEITDFGDHMKNKIQHEEKAEERSGVSRRNHPHEKNHGITREVDRLEQQIARLRNKESEHVQHDMKDGYRHKEANAVEGMRQNQKKDEDQIVKLTRKLSKGKNVATEDDYTWIPGYGPDSGAMSVGSKPSKRKISRGSPRIKSDDDTSLQSAFKKSDIDYLITPIYSPHEYYRQDLLDEYTYKTLGFFPPSSFKKAFNNDRLENTSTSSLKSLDHYPKAAPFFVSRAFLHQQPGWKPDPTGRWAGTYTQSQIVNGKQWMDNAREAHAGGKGWLGSFKDPTGVQDARSSTYANDLGTKAGHHIALSVLNPYTQKRTVMIAVNMHHPDDFQNNSNPNPRKLYLMWHDGHTEGARYIPVAGIDYNGAALSYDDDMNHKGPHSTHFGGHDQAATKHICEYASHYLPGTNYHAINPANGKKCVDDPGFLAFIHPRLYGQEKWHQVINNESIHGPKTDNDITNFNAATTIPLRTKLYNDLYENMHHNVRQAYGHYWDEGGAPTAVDDPAKRPKTKYDHLMPFVDTTTPGLQTFADHSHAFKAYEPKPGTNFGLYPQRLSLHTPYSLRSQHPDLFVPWNRI